jgi:CheY-like chemotaxis protein
LLAGLAEPHSLRVLIVDDDAGVCSALSRILGRAHHVECADSVQRALAALAEREFDVLLCDIVMPDASGADLHDDLRRTRPELARRVLFMTGGIPNDVLAGRIRASGRPVLQKPIGPTELRDALAAIASTD